MNTAQLSVLPDDLAAVSLTPLRRAAQRARAVYARFTGLAMPWSAAPAGGHADGAASIDLAAPIAGGVATPAQVEPRKRAGTLPGRWPFPPAAADAAPVGNVVQAPRERSLGNATVEPVSDQVSVKSMVLDVVLVLAWGAMIPALMWLGVAGGF
ncbi:MAG: hypothetical protein J0I68_28055 [Achromobacter sp.]|jgi:hypothetical protein|uniref:Uncharacterized protein n=1 Tax=Achromobacter insuavis TaxID=1287735 RepID=A0A6J5AJK5_9BURK|nr:MULTISPECIES: hypothetical protein [Achromobacter]MBN9642418.1 hypothetical protein [Achromobacter sp.]MCG2597482.1 hypothetical protein [Achromobacter sp.]MCG2603753.1 hypothetical protein [Achromobacter sp.]CAB3670889.1 hypothetical protein LMG26845_03767 [Achromobacter insuavis]CAB3825548.1 hypothetical protein LMG26846_00703 [Achromobacter insuavis]